MMDGIVQGERPDMEEEGKEDKERTSVLRCGVCCTARSSADRSTGRIYYVLITSEEGIRGGYNSYSRGS